MIDLLERAVACLMTRVRVNRVQRITPDGTPMIIKRRRRGGSLAIWFGNQFLALADSGICMFVRVDEWLEWEVHCVKLLYAERIGGQKAYFTEMSNRPT